MTIDEIIKMLADVRVDLGFINQKERSEDLKFLLDDVILRVDLIGCELVQNIKLKIMKN